MQFIIPNEDGLNFSCHTDHEVTDEESLSIYQSSQHQIVEEEFIYERTAMIVAFNFGFQSSTYEVIDVEQFQLREEAEGADN